MKIVNHKSVNPLIPIFIMMWLSTIGVAVFGLTTLFSPGELKTKEKGVENSELITELEIPEISADNKKPTFHFLNLMILLGICSGGSLLVTFVLKYLVTSKPKNKKFKQKKITKNTRLNSAQKLPKTKRKKEVIKENSVDKIIIDPEPIITLVSAQESTPVDRKTPSLAETLDIRKRKSLMSIMQDN